MIKKEMIAMLLAGGQGSRLGVLTAKVAKPAVAFGGKYRIIEQLHQFRNRYGWCTYSVPASAVEHTHRDRNAVGSGS